MVHAAARTGIIVTVLELKSSLLRTFYHFYTILALHETADIIKRDLHQSCGDRVDILRT